MIDCKCKSMFQISEEIGDRENLFSILEDLSLVAGAGCTQLDLTRASEPDLVMAKRALGAVQDIIAAEIARREKARIEASERIVQQRWTAEQISNWAPNPCFETKSIITPYKQLQGEDVIYDFSRRTAKSRPLLLLIHPAQRLAGFSCGILGQVSGPAMELRGDDFRKNWWVYDLHSIVSRRVNRIHHRIWINEKAGIPQGKEAELYSALCVAVGLNPDPCSGSLFHLAEELVDRLKNNIALCEELFDSTKDASPVSFCDFLETLLAGISKLSLETKGGSSQDAEL